MIKSLMCTLFVLCGWLPSQFFGDDKPRSGVQFWLEQLGRLAINNSVYERSLSEIYYYGACSFWADGNKKKAVEWFKKCLAQESFHDVEYSLARNGLKLLK